ncbi:MAG: 50S ribosomal protein L6 [Patescibacteria group bacterium]
MARFGKLPLTIPAGVQVEVNQNLIKVTGPKGSLEKTLPGVTLEQKDGVLEVKAKSGNKQSISMQGTTRSHLANMVKGVTEGWNKTLEIVGAGYRGEVRGNQLVLNIGYSHPVIVDAPQGIAFKLEKSIVTVEGIDKDMVGQVAANVRAVRKPEPYKGKGIKYTDEIVRRKAGKQAAKAA